MPIEIDSADDPRVADYLGLRDRGDAADTLDHFIAESELVLTRLVTSRFRPKSFLLSPARYERLKDVVEPTRMPVYVASRAVMTQIAGFDVHRGALASVKRRQNPTLPDVLAGARRVLVLEGSNDKENIGAVARSARALGFDAMLLDPTCADPYSRRAVRVSMGEMLHLPVMRCERWPSPIEYLEKAGFETWALTPAPEANSLFDMGMPDKVALIAGAEGPGLTAEARAAARFHVRIPMHRGVDSLNLGHALAIAMAAVALPVPG
ncbi:MAG TPA: RNA methyltransferase [Ilumatobacteraceae bacterium]|nr:RNA methyltransferase [Ilumatobacteraceae bacterium]